MLAILGLKTQNVASDNGCERPGPAGSTPTVQYAYGTEQWFSPDYSWRVLNFGVRAFGGGGMLAEVFLAGLG